MFVLKSRYKKCVNELNGLRSLNEKRLTELNELSSLNEKRLTELNELSSLNEKCLTELNELKTAASAAGGPDQRQTQFLGRLRELQLTKFESRPFMLAPNQSWPVPGKPCEFVGQMILEAPVGNLSARFTINGKPFDEVLFPLPWPGVKSLYWFSEIEDLGGFKLVCDRIPEGVSELEIRYVEKGRTERSRASSTYFIPIREEESPLPDAARRIRVIGTDSIEGFRSSGYNDFKRLDLICREFFGRELAGMGRVLDWGCGSGRVTRYLAAEARRHSNLEGIHGADIDGDNAAWCGQNLGINSRKIPLYPPTDFSDNWFDLVFGISVFTHLNEEVQFKWLAELRRIIRPGGILLTTVHGLTAYQYVGMPPSRPELAESWAPENSGFFISGNNAQLDGFIDSNDYYLNVFHRSEYIRKRWSEYFEVLEIIPGALGTHDLIVLRKRA